MKKILAALMITVFLAGAAQAGDIATIIGTDIVVGAVAGTALGAAIATPFFITGGSKDASFYMTGGGWGFVCGAGAGLLYSIWNVIYYMNGRSGAAPEKKKAFLGIEDLYLASNGAGFTLIKKF
jgi:hypothetical protein